MKTTLTILALATGLGMLGAAAAQADEQNGRNDGRNVQQAHWRGGDDNGWRKGGHGRNGHDRFGHDDRRGDRRDGDGRRGGGNMMGGMQAFDLNKDGTLTQDEVDQFRKDQIAKFDANKDGTLSIDEYQALWLDAMHLRMVRAFQQHDQDGNGQVTTDEFSGRFAGLVKRFDRNGDGKLNADDRRGGRHDRKDETQPAPAAPEAAPDATPAPAPQP